jgi:uncharacterized membrane protein
MKKLLESGAVVAWIVLVYVVVAALYGPEKLPSKVPMHFGADGKPNGWGGPESLWLLPAVGTVIAVLITVVSRFPESFNYPVRVTRENQMRLQVLALEMIAWLRLELLCLFAWIEWATIESARDQRLALPPLAMLMAIAVIFGTIAIYIVRMVRAR